MDAFAEAFPGHSVTRQEHAIYASNGGVSHALFIYPDSTERKTDAEYVTSSFGLDAQGERNSEAIMLQSIADGFAARHARALELKDDASATGTKAREDAASNDETASDAEAVDKGRPETSASPAFMSAVENPKFQLPEDERKFALVVGVENYQTIPKAEYAARDASSVRAYLKAEGYPDRNVIFLTDQQAGKASLEKYLEAWLPRNTGADSTVFFYFSGHGAPDPTKGDAYLMPWDADSKFVATTGYPVRRLYAELNALKARRVLVAMDACFSGAGGRSVLAKGARPLVSKVDEAGESVGRVGGLTASASDEITGTDDAAGHGLFTYELLRALDMRRGKATMKELFDSLSPNVRDAARRDNRDQTPQLIGDGSAAL